MKNHSRARRARRCIGPDHAPEPLLYQFKLPTANHVFLPDYRKATQRVYHAPGRESFVELPVVSGP